MATPLLEERCDSSSCSGLRFWSYGLVCICCFVAAGRMHIHRYERWWLTFGIAMLFVFLALIGFAAFADNINPPSGMQQIDPTKVSQTPPFDKPGLHRLPDGSYEAYYVAQVFSFNPTSLTVPVGSKVTFYVTSADVVHGFFVP